jgi:hypothetical protein
MKVSFRQQRHLQSLIMSKSFLMVYGLILFASSQSGCNDNEFKEGGKRAVPSQNAEAVAQNTPAVETIVDAVSSQPEPAAEKAASEPLPQQTEEPAKAPEAAPPPSEPELPQFLQDKAKEVTASTLRLDFPVSALLNGQMTVSPTRGSYQQQFTMKASYEQIDAGFKQINRPIVTKMFTQGNPNKYQTQRFSQKDMGILDIQVVIDNSGSMAEEQSNLASRLTPLLSYVTDSNWRINVVTTDPKGGCSRKVISRDSATAAADFKAAVTAGTSGSGNEMGIRMAVAGLSCAEANWVRSGSSVAVLIVSDEDNCSTGASGCAAPYNSPSYLLDHLKLTMGRNLGTQAKVYGIFKHPNKACSTAYYTGNQYNELVTATSGTWGSICDADYTATLQKISQDMRTILQADFQLNDIPDAGSTVVTVNGAVNNDFTVQGKTLRFNTPPAFGAAIEATYTVGATPLVKSFAIGENPAADTLKVTIAGAVMPAASYSFNAATKTIEFGDAPAAGAAIQVEYRQDLPLTTAFPLESGYVAASLVVTVGGQVTRDYTLGASQINLNSAPADEAPVLLSYKKSRGPVLTYPLVLNNAGDPATLAFMNKATQAPVTATYANGSVTLAPASFQEGGVVLVSYNGQPLQAAQLDLPNPPVAGTVKVSQTSGEECPFDLLGATLKLQCNLATAADFMITYRYRGEVQKSFTLPGVLNPDEGSWQVLLNGVATQAFQRQGATVTMLEELPLDGIVTLVYTL